MAKFLFLMAFLAGILFERSLAGQTIITSSKSESQSASSSSSDSSSSFSKSTSSSGPDGASQTSSSSFSSSSSSASASSSSSSSSLTIKEVSRDGDKSCSCPSKCTKPNEVYDSCPDCSPQTCETRNHTFHCELIPDDPSDPRCKPDCRCKEGFFRNKIRQCISAENCDKCQGKHEYWSCGPACDNRCDSIYGQDNCNIVNKKCNEMCYCEKGYARASNETCIPQEDCKYSCPKNEEYNKCPVKVCKAMKCSDLGFPLNCTSLKEGEPCPGEPGCICKAGYVRNSKGICILVKDCPSCGGDKNATSGCGFNCNRLCSTYDKEPRKCPLACRLNACDCRKNYVYDTNTKKCVLPCDCTRCTLPNEIYDLCDTPCPERTCAFNPAVVRCMAPPKIGDEACVVGCRCKDGFLRDDEGICIPKNECPQKCNANEYWDKCPDCKPQNCSMIGQEFPPCPPVCIPACRCNEGYARDNNGDCVPVEYCSKCTEPNEVFDPCPDCSPQTCETIDKIYHCPLIPDDPTDSRCKPACRCKKGFFRNKIGQCISEEHCAECSGNHEYWSCGSSCDNRCDSIYGQDNCNIFNVKCVEMCYCEKDYARAKNGTCIPKKDCDPICPDNEEYNKCPANVCKPKKCSELGYPLNCTIGKQDDPCPGEPGCICKTDYIRNCKGICIPIEDCPSCGGDKNATSGCGMNCNRLCSNYNKKPGVCTLPCKINGCDCREGYVFDSNIRRCVLPCDCTPVCGKNEVYSDCANGVCQVYCKDLKNNKCCDHPKVCKDGCVCKKGYLRNNKGDCIPIDECPKC